jgi:hypothetical protein
VFHASCRQYLAGSFYGSSGETSATITVFSGFAGDLSAIRGNMIKKLKRVNEGQAVGDRSRSTHDAEASDAMLTVFGFEDTINLKAALLSQ